MTKITISWRKISEDVEHCFASASIGTSARPEWIVGVGSCEAEAIGNLILDDAAEFGLEIDRKE